MTEPTNTNTSSNGNDMTNSVDGTDIEKSKEINASASNGAVNTDNGENSVEGSDKSRKRALGASEINKGSDGNSPPLEQDGDAIQPSLKKNRTDSPSTERDSAPVVFGSSTGFKSFQTGSQNKILSNAKDPNVKSVFGSSTISSNSIFGKGNIAPSNGFGSTSTTSIFGSSVVKSSFGSTLTKPEIKPTEDSPQNPETTNENTTMSSSGKTINLPEASENIINGEENEETILTLRAKLFKLAKGVKIIAVPAVKDPLGKDSKKVGIQMATKVGEVDSNENNNAPSDTAGEKNHPDNNEKDKSSVKMDWKEVGIGPLRVLKDESHVRIVQRRENTPGGQGTKLILNIRLGDKYGSLVEKKGDKFIRLAAFEMPPANKDDKKNRSEVDDELKQGDATDIKYVPVQYLFKVKTVAEADLLLKTLQKYCKKVGE